MLVLPEGVSNHFGSSLLYTLYLFPRRSIADVAVLAGACMDGVQLCDKLFFFPVLFWVLVFIKDLADGLFSENRQASAELILVRCLGVR